MYGYTQIGVPVEIKTKLKDIKGHKTWNQFFTEIIKEKEKKAK